jgi:TRL-like protein family
MRFLSHLTVKPYKAALILGLCYLTVFCCGCTTTNAVPVGILYTNVSGPLLVTNDNQSAQLGYNSVGISTTHMVLAFIQWGDASVMKAISNSSRNPESVTVSHVDFKYTSVLGCGSYSTIVYFYDPAKK